jgi:hypothetical protein
MAPRSQLLGSSAYLNGVASGTRTISALEVSDSVALVQEALVAIEESLPDSKVGGSFGEKAGLTVSAYKGNRGLVPDVRLSDLAQGPASISNGLS